MEVKTSQEIMPSNKLIISHEVVDLRKHDWTPGEYDKPNDYNRTMVTIARGKIYLYRWGTTGNIYDWQKVLATVGGQHNDMMSLTPNGSLILPNRVGGDTKWEGARNIFTDTTQLWVKILLVAGVVKPGTKVYIGNWAGSTGDFIGSAREIAKRDLSQLPHEMVFYHGTSSDRLENVKQDGLQPQARELRPWKSDALKHHPEWREHAIYLTYDKSQADYYARKAVTVARRHREKSVKKVILKITIPNTHYKRLVPDDDFLMRQLIWIGVTWLDSLKGFSQVAYLGNIPVGWISVESVADKFGWYEPEKVDERRFNEMI